MVIFPSVSTTARSFFRHFESTEGMQEDSKQYVNAMCYALVNMGLSSHAVKLPLYVPSLFWSL